MKSINNLDHKITIIMIAHRLDTVKECDQVILIEKGEIKKKELMKKLLKILKILYSKLMTKNLAKYI